jgi:poly(3-hydroxybutyrate) depolymerase
MNVQLRPLGVALVASAALGLSLGCNSSESSDTGDGETAAAEGTPSSMSAAGASTTDSSETAASGETTTVDSTPDDSSPTTGEPTTAGIPGGGEASDPAGDEASETASAADETSADDSSAADPTTDDSQGTETGDQAQSDDASDDTQSTDSSGGDTQPAEPTTDDAQPADTADDDAAPVEDMGADEPDPGDDTGDMGDPAQTSDAEQTDVAPSTGCGTPQSLESGRASIDVDGKMREYILEVPDDYDENQPYRLIFNWHPWGGSAQQVESSGYYGLVGASGGQAILVAPEGQDFQNNGLGWGNEGGEDVAFYHAMVDRFGSELCIDENRIFATGFSFGAMFSFTLACTQDSMLRAIAPQAGNATTSGRCEDGTRSVATMAFIGLDDTLLDGHRSAVQIFVERNGCSTQAVPMQASWCDELASNFEPCNCVEYPDCNDGQPVVECEYQAGHQPAPSAGSTLWNFFSQF